jgi:hypothetical protein
MKLEYIQQQSIVLGETNPVILLGLLNDLVEVPNPDPEPQILAPIIRDELLGSIPQDEIVQFDTQFAQYLGDVFTDRNLLGGYVLPRALSLGILSPETQAKIKVVLEATIPDPTYQPVFSKPRIVSAGFDLANFAEVREALNV